MSIYVHKILDVYHNYSLDRITTYKNHELALQVVHLSTSLSLSEFLAANAKVSACIIPYTYYPLAICCLAIEAMAHRNS